MVKSYAPCKANPVNVKFLKHLHNLLGNGLSFEEFLKSRDSIYMCIDPASAYHMYEYKCPIEIYSFLTCRRINASDIDNEQLKFHCTPYNIVYYIDNVYFNNAIMFDNDEYCYIFEMLMKINAASKRDAFIMIKLTEEQRTFLEESLISMGYCKSDTIEDNIHTYFRSPIT